MSAFRNALRRSLLQSKRHTAIFCYNSPSWRQPQQLRQRLIPLRRIQSSGAFGRSASTAGDQICARPVAAPASASTAGGAARAGRAGAQAFASTAGGAPSARPAVAQAFASTAGYANTARPAVAYTFATTASGASVAPSARTSRAPWKDVHCSATVFAVSKSC